MLWGAKSSSMSSSISKMAMGLSPKCPRRSWLAFCSIVSPPPRPRCPPAADGITAEFSTPARPNELESHLGVGDLAIAISFARSSSSPAGAVRTNSWATFRPRSSKRCSARSRACFAVCGARTPVGWDSWPAQWASSSCLGGNLPMRGGLTRLTSTTLLIASSRALRARKSFDGHAIPPDG